MFGKKTNGGRPRANDLSAFIDEGSEIEGKYTFSGTVMLNGTFRGDITSTDTLIIGEKGVAHATIRAGVIVVSGQVFGNLIATERVELRRPARVFGDIDSPVVVLEEGVLFEGHCRMTPPAAAAPAVPTAAPAAPTAVPAQRDLSIVR